MTLVRLMNQKLKGFQMKAFLILFTLFTFSVNAQLKTNTGQPIDIRGGITSPVPGSLLSFLDRDHFRMTQSYGMSYYSGGGQSGTLGMYTNSMNFRLSDPLLLRLNIGVMHQPFGAPKGSKNQNAQVMQGMELIYRPNKYFQFQAGFSNTPFVNSSAGAGVFNQFVPNYSTRGFEDYGFNK